MKLAFSIMAISLMVFAGCQKKSSKKGASAGNQTTATTTSTKTDPVPTTTPIVVNPTTPAITGLTCSSTSVGSSEEKTVILDLISNPKRMQIKYANNETQVYNLTATSKSWLYPTFDRYTVQDAASSVESDGWVAVDPDSKTGFLRREREGGFRKVVFSGVPLSKGDSKSLTGFMECK
jgi:hypothetical protein